MQKFQDVFTQLNKSYFRTKHFIGKSHESNDKLFYQTFIQKPKKTRSIPQRTTRIHINRARSSFEYFEYSDLADLPSEEVTL